MTDRHQWFHFMAYACSVITIRLKKIFVFDLHSWIYYVLEIQLFRSIDIQLKISFFFIKFQQPHHFVTFSIHLLNCISRFEPFIYDIAID